MKKTNTETFGFILHDVARMMRWDFDRRAQALGLTRSQWSVLAHLLREDGVQQKQLAARMDVAAITLSGLLDRMERDGWVVRQDDPGDRRAKRIFLTEKVAPVTERISAIGAQVRQDALTGLKREEQQQLMLLLKRVRQNLSTKQTSSSDVPTQQGEK